MNSTYTSEPKHSAIADTLRRRIRAGALAAGSRLPSLAKLQAEFKVSQDTAERAYNVLEQEGLIIRRHRSGTFVAPPEATNKQIVVGISGIGFRFTEEQYWAQLVQGINDTAAKAQAQVTLLGVVSTDGWEKADGILVCDWSTNDQTRLIPSLLPCVSVLVPTNEISCVVADDYQGARLTTEYLLGLGHRKIAYLYSSDKSVMARRLAGYRDALIENGVEFNAQWERAMAGHYIAGVPYVFGGRDQMRSWLREGWRELGCTAILTQNDEIAMGVIEALREAGLRVPEDVSVVGFDGADSRSYFSPRLTTVKLPLRQIGAAAMDLLLSQIKSDEPYVERRVLPVELEIGESTAGVAK
jgi:DNA-binding LacI/PurR family transcriptional regulator